ncbi:MAG: hypothetical protein LUQ50_06090, partial [Methanospirillum sp.]|uniref:CHASE4 domain-containing protein n=1 Tax=Methanospirillum sp. TaxID=45200 RepID=UPI00236B380B
MNILSNTPMNLRRKTLFILGLLLLGAVALILGVSYTVLIGSYAGFEEQSSRDSVVQGLKAIDYERSLIESKCGEWSRWDETYSFISGNNPGYVKQNLNTDSFDNLGVDLFVILNQTRSVRFATWYNSTSHLTSDLQPGDLSSLVNASYLYTHGDLISSRSGFLIRGPDPMLVVSQPVLTSQYEGPSAGYLLLG